MSRHEGPDRRMTATPDFTMGPDDSAKMVSAWELGLTPLARLGFDVENLLLNSASALKVRSIFVRCDGDTKAAACWPFPSNLATFVGRFRRNSIA